MKNILIMAYAFSPFKGSEFSLGWNLVTGLSCKYKVTVLVGSSDGELGETTQLTEFLKSYNNENLDIVIVKPPLISRYLNILNLWGAKFAFYWAFSVWHRAAYKRAKKLILARKYDLVHQLGPIGFREPGYLWKLGLPFVWGPIGGAQSVNLQLTKNMPLNIKVGFFLKNIVNHIQLRFSKRVLGAVEKSAFLFYATEENQRNFIKVHGVGGPIISDQACFSDYSHFLSEKKPEQDSCVEKVVDSIETIRFVWCGSVIHRKNLRFILDALSRLNNIEKTVDWELAIVGDGPLADACRRYAMRKSIEKHIKWYGRLDRIETVAVIKKADLHLMASLSEANTAVLYEATENLIPTLSLDRDGMSTELSKGRGFLVEIMSSYEATVNNYSTAIASILQRPELLEKVKWRLREDISQYSWDNKVEVVSGIYKKVIG
ncbi:glycosyltransferase involved in cell wall biosynthesis [Alteromonadaceae bacterium 2753L.S.0a.02]|nr:glycosyltransferase involved in cell wall biosynthesis [Alteromonadaceae bacterium 2753L.S.0a.02]